MQTMYDTWGSLFIQIMSGGSWGPDAGYGVGGPVRGWDYNFLTGEGKILQNARREVALVNAYLTGMLGDIAFDNSSILSTPALPNSNRDRQQYFHSCTEGFPMTERMGRYLRIGPTYDVDYSMPYSQFTRYVRRNLESMTQNLVFGIPAATCYFCDLEPRIPDGQPFQLPNTSRFTFCNPDPTDYWNGRDWCYVTFPSCLNCPTWDKVGDLVTSLLGDSLVSGQWARATTGLGATDYFTRFLGFVMSAVGRPVILPGLPQHPDVVDSSRAPYTIAVGTSPYMYGEATVAFFHDALGYKNIGVLSRSSAESDDALDGLRSYAARVGATVFVARGQYKLNFASTAGDVTRFALDWLFLEALNLHIFTAELYSLMYVYLHSYPAAANIKFGRPARLWMLGDIRQLTFSNSIEQLYPFYALGGIFLQQHSWHYRLFKSNDWGPAYDAFCEWYRGHTGPTNFPITEESLEYIEDNSFGGRESTFYGGGVYLTGKSAAGTRPYNYQFSNHAADYGPCVPPTALIAGSEWDRLSHYKQDGWIWSAIYNMWGTYFDSMFMLRWADAKATQMYGANYDAATFTEVARSFPVRGVGSQLFFEDGRGNRTRASLATITIQQLVPFHAEGIGYALFKDSLKLLAKVNVTEAGPSVPAQVVPYITPGNKPWRVPDQDLVCDAGSFYDLQLGTCVDCLPGFFAVAGARGACEQCHAGTASGAKAGTCSVCAAGRFSIAGAAECTDCTMGKFAAKAESSMCLDCTAGSYTDEIAQLECKNCNPGFYLPEDGQTACAQCPELTTTLSFGTVLADGCVCEENTYRPNTTGGRCYLCAEDYPLEAVNCSQTNGQVLLKNGFMTLGGAAERTIYRCEDDSPSVCLGGVPTTAPVELQCAPGGGGIACSRCDKEYEFDDVEQECVKCEDASVIGLVVVALIFFIGLLVRLRPHATRFTEQELHRFMLFTVGFTPIAQACEFLQVCHLFSLARMVFPDAVEIFFKRIGSFFDINLYSLECKMADSRNTYAMSYAILLNVLPLLCHTLIFVLCLPSVLSKALQKARAPSIVLGINIVLSLNSIFLMTILNFSLSLGFRVVKHPARQGMEGAQTFAAFPYLLTDEDQGKTLRAFAVASFAAWCILAVIVPCTLVFLRSRRVESKMLRRCTFVLVSKYSDGMSWWFAFEISVKIVVALIAVASYDPSIQLQALAFVFIIYAALTIVSQPFRYYRHYVCEVVVAGAKVLVLILGMTSSQSNAKDKTGAIIVVVCVTLVICVAAMVRGLYKTWKDPDSLHNTNDEESVSKIRDVIGFVLPKYPPNYGIGTLVPESEMLRDYDKVFKQPGEKQESAALEEPEELKTLQKDIKVLKALVNIKYKQACALWTIAQGWAPPESCPCTQFAELQSEVTAKAGDDEFLQLVRGNLQQQRQLLGTVNV